MTKFRIQYCNTKVTKPQFCKSTVTYFVRIQYHFIRNLLCFFSILSINQATQLDRDFKLFIQNLIINGLMQTIIILNKYHYIKYYYRRLVLIMNIIYLFFTPHTVPTIIATRDRSSRGKCARLACKALSLTLIRAHKTRVTFKKIRNHTTILNYTLSARASRS